MSHDASGSARRRLLILAPAFPPDPFSGAARPGRFARYLPEFGYDVDVIAGRHGPPETAQVRRVPYGRGPGPGERLANVAWWLRRLLPHDDELPFAAQVLEAADALTRERTYDIILSTGPPMGLHAAALWLKRRHGTPCVCDFRDPLVGNPFRGRPWLFPHDAWLESWFARSSDAVICNTDEAGAAWRARHPQQAARVEVIWNGYDPDEALKAKIDETCRVLAHVGTFYGGRHPGVLLNSLERLIANGELAASEARLELAGPVETGSLDHLTKVMECLEKKGVLTVDARTLPPDEAARVADRAGALLLVDLNEKEQGVQVPAKLFGYVLSGKPVLALTYEASPALKILEMACTPYTWVDPRWTAERTDAAVKKFFKLAWTARRPSEEFRQRFDGRIQTGTLARLLGRILSGG